MVVPTSAGLASTATGPGANLMARIVVARTIGSQSNACGQLGCLPCKPAMSSLAGALFLLLLLAPICFASGGGASVSKGCHHRNSSFPSHAHLALKQTVMRPAQPDGTLCQALPCRHPAPGPCSHAPAQHPTSPPLAAQLPCLLPHPLAWSLHPARSTALHRRVALHQHAGVDDRCLPPPHWIVQTQLHTVAWGSLRGGCWRRGRRGHPGGRDQRLWGRRGTQAGHRLRQRARGA